MNIDMSRFHQGFFDEVAEHLENLERIMLALDVNAPSRDQLDELFRVAHSIKGGAGTFGFTEMASFTHVLESLLGKVRNGEIALSEALVDLTLRAGDVLRSQLQNYRAGSAVDPALSAGVVGELEAALKAATEPACKVPSDVSAGCEDLASPSPASTRYRITYACAQPEPARSSVHAGLRSALAAAGKLERGPGGNRVDDWPWTYVLSTAATEADVRDLFAFVECPGDELEIVAADDPADGSVRPSTSEPAHGLFDEESKFATAPPVFGFFDGAPGTPSAESATSRPTVGRDADPSKQSAQRAGSAPGKSAEARTVRVDLGKVDGLINLVGEMVIAQAMLARVAAREDDRTSDEMRAAIKQMQRHTRDLRESVMSIRMIPMSVVFSRFPRMVRDLAASLGKRVSLQTIGDDTELDKGLIENIVDPLTHLVRNALDHGIERPEERVAAGKDAGGTIVLRSSHQSGNVVIEVIDDGRGLDREKILARARTQGLAVSAEMTDSDVWQLIFAAGLSTVEQVTDVSGRGVGMDVVKRNISAIGGRVEITSQRSIGMHVTIRLPLTLAILDGLSVSVGADVFIIPLAHVVESVQPDADSIQPLADRGDIVHFRGQFIPIVRLYELFKLEHRTECYTDGIFIVVEIDGTKAAIFVDSLEAQHQLVIKSIKANFRAVEGIAGATSLGDGRVSLILDCASLLRMSGTLDPAA